MSPRLSVLLDVMRLAAAAAVLCAHLSDLLLKDMPLWLSRHGQEAVSVFFVLSGFVIAYSCERKPTCWRTYAKARAARLYSVVLPVMLVVIIIDSLGRSYNPGWYSSHSFVGPDPTLYSFSAILTFTNELWFRHVVIGSSEPFWSLGFEVAYYLLFGILLFSRGVARYGLCVAWALLVGFKILLYLPIWLTGVIAWRIVRAGVPVLTVKAAWLILMLVPLTYSFWRANCGGQDAQFDWTSTTSVLASASYHFGIGLIVAAGIIALSIVTRDKPAFGSSVARPTQWLAGASFTLYLLHQPLIAFAAATITSAAPGLLKSAAVVAVLTVVLILAEIGERRKALYLLWLEKLLSGVCAIRRRTVQFASV